MGFKLAAVMALVTGLILAGFYWYYNDTQEKLAILHENNAKLETAAKLQKQAIEEMEQQVELVNAIAKTTSEEIVKSREKIEVINKKFNKQSKLLGSRDMGKLAISKPSPIKNIVNRGTVDIMRCFEIVSGKSLTEKEKNAEKPSQLNRSCPDIANPNRVQR